MILRAAIVAVLLAQAPLRDTAADATSVIVTRPGSDTTRSTLSFAPVLVGGTYLVPAREIFRALGIPVRAHGDEITATFVSTVAQGPIAIVMRVDHAQAIVGGNTIAVSPPPALIAGTLFVPLRFVETATGDAMRFDRGQHTIYVTLPRLQPAATPQPATPAPVPASALPVPIAPAAVPAPTPEPTPTPIELPTASIVLRLVREEPARGTTVDRDRPEISASFGEPVAGTTVRVLLDGREITSDVTITNRYFIYEPSNDLAAGTHEIVVGGRTALHESFTDRWSFDSASAKNHNFLAGVEPPSGISVTSPLVVSGITRPRSRIGMVATSSETAAHFSELSGGSYTDHAVADGRGTFEFRLDLVDRGSGFLDIRLDSTAPDGAVAVKTLRLRL